MSKHSNYHNYKFHKKQHDMRDAITPTKKYVRESYKLLKLSKLIKKLINLKNSRLNPLNLKHKYYKDKCRIEFTFINYDIAIQLNTRNYYNIYLNNCKQNVQDIEALNQKLYNYFSKLFDTHKNINNVLDFFQYSDCEIDHENTKPPRLIVKTEQNTLYGGIWTITMGGNFIRELRNYNRILVFETSIFDG